jgi:hypothetical protein
MAMPTKKTDVLAQYPTGPRRRLEALRRLIRDTARRTAGVGRLEETLKWGQPSFLTPETGSGSTIRIDARKDGGTAMYFHCQTNLVRTFRQLYPDEFVFEGNRALVFGSESKPPEQALRHCIALALTYHQNKKTSRSR